MLWLVTSSPQHLLFGSTRQGKTKFALSFEQVDFIQVKASPKFRERRTGRKALETPVPQTNSVSFSWSLTLGL